MEVETIMVCKIKITTVLMNEFVEVVDIKDFNEQSVRKSIESTKEQIGKGLNIKDITIEADTQILWES